MNTRRPAFLHLNHGPLNVRVERLRIEATHTHPERQEATWERTNSLLRVTNVEPGDNMILLGDDFAKCLTNDHMRAGEMVRMKMLSPEKVRTHAQRSVLSKCLGVGLFVQPDIFQVQVQEGDIIVLCTDGVWSVVEDAEFSLLATACSGPEDLS